MNERFSKLMQSIKESSKIIKVLTLDSAVLADIRQKYDLNEESLLVRLFLKDKRYGQKTIKPEDYVFEKHGFVQHKDSNKKIYVRFKEFEYQFDYETNKIYEIKGENIKFAVCVKGEKQILFINQDYILLDDSTRPYRTFYDGLMKVSFRYCYLFDEQVIIDVKKGDRLIFDIVNC